MLQIDTSQLTASHDSTAQAQQSSNHATLPVADDTPVHTHAATARPTPLPVYNTVVPTTLLKPADSVFNVQADTADYLLLCNDSLFDSYKSLTAQYRESMFAGNGRSATETRPMTRHNEFGNAWVFGVIVLLFALMSIYLNSQKFRLRDIFMSLFVHRVQERVFRESNLKSRTLLPMTGIYLASLSFVVLRAASQWFVYVPHLNPYTFYLMILVSLIGFILAKTVLTRMLGEVFNSTNSINTYIASNHLFYFIGALVLLPMTLLLFFCSFSQATLLHASIIFIVILFVIRVLRGIQLILTNSKNSKLHLFYYLCILEIVPILAIIKVITT